jgi:hypothetical protein
LERRQQKMPPSPSRVSTTRGKGVPLFVPFPAIPPGAWWTEESIDGLTFFGSRVGVQEMKVH